MKRLIHFHTEEREQNKTRAHTHTDTHTHTHTNPHTHTHKHTHTKMNAEESKWMTDDAKKFSCIFHKTESNSLCVFRFIDCIKKWMELRGLKSEGDVRPWSAGFKNKSDCM